LRWTFPKWLQYTIKLLVIVLDGITHAKCLLLSWWWLPLGQKSMIPPCFDTPSEFLVKIAGVNMYGFSEKQSFNVPEEQSIHWIVGTNNCLVGSVINWL
jgi:hypothetical protein